MKFVHLSLLFFMPLSGMAQTSVESQAEAFLKIYNSFNQPLATVSSEAQWKAVTDVKEETVGERIGTENAGATFWGNRYVIERAKYFLRHKKELKTLTRLQIQEVISSATRYPATIPDVVSALVEAEAKEAEVLDGFTFCLQRVQDKCVQPITPNEITKILESEPSLSKRLAAWEASKEVGSLLKNGLEELRNLRNRVAREMGFTSFFHAQVADYDMSVSEMMDLLNKSLTELKPLYDQAHCYAKYELAKRFGQSVPKRIPAHWLGNRWGQSWPGMIQTVKMDDLFEGKSAKWIVEQAEKFYVTLGFSKLPSRFWEKSDLYPLPASATRKKNTHASAWHMDLRSDVRSLMNIEPNFDWFGTAHHELGHIYYYLSYSIPEVPELLRQGANRAFHEGIGDLIFIAATQPKYMRKIGLLPPNRKIDETEQLLNDLFVQSPIFIPFAAGVMSHFEHDLYEKELSKTDFNKRWWDLVQQ